MVWFKVDDKLPGHRKARALLRANRQDSLGVWVLCGAWTSAHGEDGFVPLEIVQGFAGGSSKRATVMIGGLISAGFAEWADKDGEHGVQLVSFSEWNPTAVEAEAKRAAKAEAGRVGGQRSGEVRRAKSEASGSRESEASASAVVEPRPDPTRPDEHFGYEVMSSTVSNVRGAA